MEPIVSTLGLKAAAPALLASYRAFSREWSRRTTGEGTTLIPALEKAIDEAMDVLAQQADGPLALARVGLQGMLSRPDLLRHSVPNAWIRTEPTQTALKAAVHALIRGEPDTPHAAIAVSHYRGFLDEEGAEDAPSSDDCYALALEFILRSITRDLTLGDQVILSAIDSAREQIIATVAPENSAILDAHILRELSHIRQRRFFRSSNTESDVIALCSALLDGALRGASAGIRSNALAWGARLIAYAEPELAGIYCARARQLAGAMFEELWIAEAFVAAGQDWTAALAMLDPDATALQATAAFQIIRKGLESGAARAHAAKAGIQFEQLDGDGRFAWITSAIEVGQWSEALHAIRQLSEADFEQTPSLLYVAGTGLVAARVPADLRPAVLQDIPPNANWFKLAEDGPAIEERHLARAYMEEVAERCRTLGLEAEAQAARRYSLWLALRDPETREQALHLLRDRMADPAARIGHLPLALGFGLDVDIDQAISIIEREATRNPKSSQLAPAITALIFSQAPEAPTAAANLMARYRKLLSDYLAPESLVALEVQLLVDAGRKEQAQALLAAQGEDTAPTSLRTVLESMLAEDSTRPSIEALEESYAQNPQTHLLGQLVQRHREAGNAERHLELARQLLRQIPNEQDAVELLQYLIETRRDRDAREVIDELGDLVDRSDPLLSRAAWLHYRGGRLDMAEVALKRLEKRRDDESDRALRYHLLLASGRWPELDTFVEQQWMARASRTALDLSRCATLAAQVGSKRTLEFILEAVRRDPDDPNVLVAAFAAATKAGVESELEQAGSWIARAAANSGDDGPIRHTSLEEVIKDAPEWNARVEEATRLFAAGEAPLGLIAAMVRRPWLELHLIPLLFNPMASDVRHQALVPLFSGRWSMDMGLEVDGVEVVALDRTAVVTLAAFDLLEPVLNAFETVFVEHDLLSDLFDQRQRVDFHQPSLVGFAHHLGTLLAKGRVKPFLSSVSVDRRLSAEIGERLAELLSEASAQKKGQHVVIHPYPISRAGSLLTEPAELGAYQGKLASCSAVVDVLKREGRLTSGQLARARAYFELHDQRWPDEPGINPGATLYLSDLAVSYFRYTGLLERIESAGLTVLVSQSELEEAEALRERESIAQKVADVVEDVRAQISGGLSSGRISLDAEPIDDDPQRRPLVAMARLGERAALSVYDDRCINRHLNINHDEGRSRICSSLALVEALVRARRIEPQVVADVRTRLRLGGAAYIPVSAEELFELLAECQIDGDRVRETAELRALRENLRLAQLRGWLDPAHEAYWLMGLQIALVGALMRQWDDVIADGIARARSDWLMGLIDMRDWSDSVVNPLFDLASTGLLLDFSRICTATAELTEEASSRFADWFETAVAEPLWAEEPRLKAKFIDHLRGMIVSLGRTKFPEHPEIDARSRMRAGLTNIPSFLHHAMVENLLFRKKLGLRVDPIATLGEDAAFKRSSLFAVVARAYADRGRTVTAKDEEGKSWRVRSEDNGTLLVERNKKSLRVRAIFGLMPDTGARLEAFDTLLVKYDIPPASVSAWRERIAAAPLDPDAIEALDDDLAAFPGAFRSALEQSLEDGEATLSLLVPPQRLYYERLIGAGFATTLPNYVEEILPAHVSTLRADNAIERAKQLLLLASHPSILAERRLGTLDESEWLALGTWVEESGDPLAIIGFLEVGLEQVSTRPALEPCLLSLIDRLERLDPAASDGLLHLFSSLAILVDGELSQAGTLAEWSPFQRRLAAFAQAAILTRAVAGQIDTAHFAKFAVEKRGWRFFIQSLTDLRAEPRWRPDHITADQWRHELLGRLINLAGEIGAQRLTPALAAALLAGPDSLHSRLPFPMSFWPGPLEGSAESPRRDCPENLVEMLEQGLSEVTLDPTTLNVLANIDSMFAIPPDLFARAVGRIREAGSQVLASVDKNQVETSLLGLAYVAASQRSTELAEITSRFIGDWRVEAELGFSERLQLALVSAASRVDLAEWRVQVGQSLLSIASTVQTKDDANLVETWLQTLCIIDPGLRATASRALASLRLVRGA